MDIIKRLHNQDWFVVSACKGKRTDDEHTARLQVLLYWAFIGGEVFEAAGMWEGQSEKSFLVFGDIAAAESFGKMFDQTHILTSAGLVGLQEVEFKPLAGIISGNDVDTSAPHTVLRDGTKFQAVLAGD